MGLIRSLFRAGPAPHDDFWYQPIGYSVTSATGVRVSPDMALRLSAVWACVRLISDLTSILPLPIYRFLPAGGKERAPEHPLYQTLQNRANFWQTAQGFRQQLTVHALLRGAGFARIVDTERGRHTGLEPLNPDWLQLPKPPLDPYSVYIYREPGKPDQHINQGSIFRLDGPTLDGYTPVSVVTYARESMGLGLAAESYAGRVYSQDGRPRGVLEHPGKLSKEAMERLSESWQASYAGLSNAHKVAVLQEGMKFSSISVSPEDAQMIASREFSVEDLARWFGVPPHLIGSTAKTTSWGSGIEQMTLGFVKFTLLPWLQRWEQSIQRDLIFDKDVFFAEHVLDGLMRGDLLSRYKAYAIGRQGTWLSANEVRGWENLNPRPGGDEYDNPAITVTDASGQPDDADEEEDEDDDNP